MSVKQTKFTFFVNSAHMCVCLCTHLHVCVHSGRQQQQLGGVWEELRDGVDAHGCQRHPQGADRGDASVCRTPSLPKDQSAEVPSSHGSSGHPTRPW